jgi:hypothetical protein
MSDERVQAALRILAEADRGKEASPEVEARLQAAFRRQRPAPAWRNSWMWPAIAAAAVLTVVMVSDWRARTPQPPIQAVAPVPAALPVREPATETVSTAAEKPPPVRRTRPAARREIVTDFFPLVDYAAPFERGELVRVSLPASAMRTVGLPVREERLMDRVQADVLVGQEGLARAIRFVSYSQ